MSTVAEIEAAIKALPPAERARLAEDLPSNLPELDGDLAWQRIIGDARPRPRSRRWAMKSKSVQNQPTRSGTNVTTWMSLLL